MVPAGSRVRVPFTLTVPEDATPGDHSGGIVTSLVSERDEGLSVDRRLGSRIHVRVSGDLVPVLAVEQLDVGYDGTINPVGSGTAGVGFTLRNTGNIRLAGVQEVTVGGPFGWGARTETVEIPELLPGDTHEVTLSIAGVRPLVRLGTEVRVSPRILGEAVAVAPEPAVASTSTWALPWSLLILAAALVLAIAGARWRGKRRDSATERRVAAAVAAALAEQSSAELDPPLDADLREEPLVVAHHEQGTSM